MTTSFASTSHNNRLENIAVFYHVYQYGDWLDVVQEQVGLLYSSGLYEASSFFHIGVNGSQELPNPGDKFSIHYNPHPWTEETPTLQSLRQFCEQNPEWKVLYFHTKGITQPSKQTNDWRKVMEHFCIERWSDSVEMLDRHDTVGCLFMDDCYYGFYPHYSGNFWWAKSQYVQKLDHSYLNQGIRQNREFWIGTGGGSMFSFLNTGLNHYANEFPRHLYT